MSGLQSWFDRGQNRECGGRTAERTDYAASQECADPNPATGGH